MSSPIAKYEVIDLTEEHQTTTVVTTAKEVHQDEEEQEEESDADVPPQKRQKPNCDSDSEDSDSGEDNDSEDSDCEAEREKWVKKMVYKSEFAANIGKGMSKEMAHDLATSYANKNSCFFRHLSYTDYKKEQTAYKARNLCKDDASYDSYYEDSDC
jgi:hypothetical protein